MNEVAYEVIAKGKGKLRLYLNDPLIMKQLTQTTKEHELMVEIPIPLELNGEIVEGKTEDEKMHYFFAHDNPSFITVFFDLDVKKLEKPK
jgi:hypothetical protein